MSKEILEQLSDLFFDIIILVPLKEYVQFLPKAKELLKGHEKDEDFVALCLYKGIKLWIYEDLLFKIGIAISTKQISEKLSFSSSEKFV